MEKRIAVIGSGSWATAIVKMLCNNNTKVNWWVRKKETLLFIEQYMHNPKYLPSVKFDKEKIAVSNNLKKIVSESDILIAAIPSAFIHSALSTLNQEDYINKILFSAIKGIIPEFNSIPAHYFHQQLGIPYENIGIISGPCHAEEVAMERLSYLTIACSKPSFAEIMAANLDCRYIKTSVSDDLLGTELSAILKNVYAVAAGICHGLGYGDNFQAVLIANSIQEISRFVDAVHPIHRDVKSSAYLGDLLVTAYSQFSRNRTFGNIDSMAPVSR